MMMNNLCIYDKCSFSNLFVLANLMSAGIFVSAVSIVVLEFLTSS